MTRSQCFAMAIKAVMRAGYELEETIAIVDVLLTERKLAEYTEKQTGPSIAPDHGERSR